MQTTALVLHNILRWAVILFGLFTVLNAFTGIIKKRVFTESDNKSNLLFMISCDIQLVLGLALYFGGQWFDDDKPTFDSNIGAPSINLESCSAQARE